MKMKDTLKIL